MVTSRGFLKSIVMVGASLTGCGGVTVARSGDGDGIPSGAGGTAAAGATTGGTPSTSGGTAAETGGSIMESGGAFSIGGSAPMPMPDAGPPMLKPEDCAFTQNFNCMCTSTVDGPHVEEPCLPATRNGRNMRCSCEGLGPLDPSNCPSSEQFYCLDWTGKGTGCRCRANAPKSADDCMISNIASSFTCHSYDPPVGCECYCCVIR